MDEQEFHHPFEPYPIQRQFMTALYDCIEQGKVGIFESPTGTGKSLSLICGSLTWLRDHKRRLLYETLDVEPADDDEPEWMIEHARNEKKQSALQKRKDLEEKLSRARRKEEKFNNKYGHSDLPNKRRRIDEVAGAEDGDQFILDDYESDQETQKGSKPPELSDLGLSAETQTLLKKLGMNLSKSDPQDENESQDELKIFYCSRTHSQLSQFAAELRKVKMPSALSGLTADGTQDLGKEDSAEELKHLTLGSRKNLCINPKVNKLSSTSTINEKCLELQKPNGSKDEKCSFFPTKEDAGALEEFQSLTLAKIRDIEDLGNLGRNLGVCPYYASRPAIKLSEIVTLPYPLLLQKSVREALHLSLKDHVVIIDEAHNLMESITSIYSVSVSLSQLQRGRSQLMIYLQKFRNRLKGKNRIYVAQAVRMVDSIATYLQSKARSVDSEGLVQIGDLMAGKGVDQINLFKLERYLKESHLARKVDGYIVYAENQTSKNDASKTQTLNRRESNEATPVLSSIQTFMLALMNPSAEGRFFYSKDEHQQVSLKYMLLDPRYHFKEIVEEARAVILAGGTMSPMDDYMNFLFPYLPKSRITTLSCGHVVPSSSLLAFPVTKDSKGDSFDFTYEKRSSKPMIQSVGETILRFIKVIPSGVVVFFPSYAYLDLCLKIWKSANYTQANASLSLWDAICLQKPIFLEHRSRQPMSSLGVSHDSKAGESVLSAYSNAIHNSPNHRGALLLAVINGSLSEGINFSDSLGRAVIVLGLPFPNPHSVEWNVKMEYISKMTYDAKVAQGLSANEAKAASSAATKSFYENVAMRAVNQAIGRAIRHQNDYAAILLIDRRYGDGRISQKLPGWIKGSISTESRAETVVEHLGSFFKRMEAKRTT